MIKADGKYQTRDGRPVRILCVDRPHSKYTVVGLLKCGDLSVWTAEGVYSAEGLRPDRDLIPVPEKRRLVGWVNVYEALEPCFHLTREAADQSAGQLIIRVACVEVNQEYEVGSGLTN